MMNKQTPNTDKSKLPCRRAQDDRRTSAKPPSFPMLDSNGAKINSDRRTSPDRRYDVEIQWLRG